MKAFPLLDQMKTITNNNKLNRNSYQTTKKKKDRYNGSELQHIPTRTTKDKLIRARTLALKREGKFKGALQRVIDEALEIGLTEMESNLHQTASYSISDGEYRADKIDRLMRMKTLFKVWDTESSSSSYPFFHLMTIRKIIKDVCNQSRIHDERTMFTLKNSYQKIILKLSKEVSNSRFDITGFMEHEFTD